MDGNIKEYMQKVCSQKVCSNCKNKHCERGIYVTKYNNMIITKCCDYIRKDSNKEEQQELIEFMKYCKDKVKRKREI